MDVLRSFFVCLHNYFYSKSTQYEKTGGRWFDNKLREKSQMTPRDTRYAGLCGGSKGQVRAREPVVAIVLCSSPSSVASKDAGNELTVVESFS